MFWHHHVRFVLSSVALFFALFVLAVSLSKTPTTVLSADGQFESSRRQLYLSDEILPDHVAYPVLMAIDRVKLEAASPEERVFIQIEYANRRMDYVHALLEKNNQTIALSTATKAEKYLLHAGQDVLDHKLSPHAHQAVLGALEYQNQQFNEMKPKFNADADRAVLDQIVNEGTVMAERVRSALTLLK